MPLVVADRVRETTTTTGTGTITLAGTVTGYQSFSAIGNGNTTYYTINAGAQWEVGIGTYLGAGPTLSRDTVLESSNAGALVNFSAGTKDVFVTYPAEKSISDGYGLLPIANGGTGTATAFTAGSVVFAGVSGVYSQDNANLFWDNANDRLGIGTSSPATKLDVKGDGTFRNGSGVVIGNVQNSSGWYDFAGSADVNGAQISTPNTTPVRFLTNATERMRIASDGGITAYGNGTTNADQIWDAGGTVKLYAQANTTNGYATLGTITNHALNFLTNSTERMRIDASGNVGIGTSSPVAKLDVRGAVWGNYNSTGTAFFTSDGASTDLTISTATNETRLFNGGGSASLTFGTVGTERMRIDSSGNVGVGVTPTTGGYGRGIQISGDAASDLGTLWTQPINTNDHRISLTNNAKNSGVATWAYNASSQSATMYEQLSGIHRWFTAGTGTANATISFSESMRIDASGNVGIGTSSPARKLDVNGSIRLGDAQALEWGGVAYAIVGDNAGAMLFKTASSERMRIDASGNLMVGKTAVSITAVGNEMRSDGGVSSTRSGSTNATSTFEVYSAGAAAYRFFVDMAGTISATSATINALSDIRLKENVRDLDTGLDTILALKPRRFDWKAGKGKDVRDDMGFIAQEVEEVLPALIGGWKAGEGEPDDLKSVKAGDLIPVLVKAIQELTARVAQLEGK